MIGFGQFGFNSHYESHLECDGCLRVTVKEENITSFVVVLAL
jgi:hypothetical protein